MKYIFTKNIKMKSKVAEKWDNISYALFESALQPAIHPKSSISHEAERIHHFIS